MKFEIKNRYNGDVQFKCTLEKDYGSYSLNLGAAVKLAIKQDANLQDVDLVLIQFPLWTAYIQKEHIRIGCQYNKADELFGFDDATIDAMDPNALVWWKQWKPVIQSAHEALIKEQDNGR